MAKEVRKLLFGDHDPYQNLGLYPFNGHGWSSEHYVFNNFISQYKPKLIVEVGTFFGGSARAMTRIALENNIENFELVCIDTFLGSVEHWNRSSFVLDFKNGRPTIYDQFISNVVHSGYQEYITPFPVDSQNGFLFFQEKNIIPDLVYIDAGHDYESVKRDLYNWASLVNLGGIIIGDDWHHPPIKQAVADTFKDNILEFGEKFVWIK